MTASGMTPTQRRLRNRFCSGTNVTAHTFGRFHSTQRAVRDLRRVRSRFDICRHSTAVRPTLIRITATYIRRLTRGLPRYRRSCIENGLNLSDHPLNRKVLRLLTGLRNHTNTTELRVALHSVVYYYRAARSLSSASCH